MADDIHLVVTGLFADSKGRLHQLGERIEDPETIADARAHWPTHVRPVDPVHVAFARQHPDKAEALRRAEAPADEAPVPAVVKE